MNKTSLVSGLLLFFSWIASVAGFRITQDSFADFKIEMPVVTLWGILLTSPTLLVPLTLSVLVVAVLLACRLKIG